MLAFEIAFLDRRYASRKECLVPDDIPDRDSLYPAEEEWINPGDSAVIAPGGEIIAGPMRQEKGILFAEVDLERGGISKRDLDVTGHYSRPDIFTLSVDKQPQSPIKFNQE